MASLRVQLRAILVHLICRIAVISAYFGHEAELDAMTPNLFGNAEFDDPVSTTANTAEWYVMGAATTTVSLQSVGCLSGSSCVSVTNRNALWKGIRSPVSADKMAPDTPYWVSMFIKFTEDRNVSFDPSFIMKIRYIDTTELYTGMFTLDNTRASDQWLYVGLDFRTSATLTNILSYEFYIDAPTGVSYMMDATSLRNISYPNWREHALNYIEAHRKGNVALEIYTSACFDPSLVNVQIRQSTGAFGFGSAVRADVIDNRTLDSGIDNNRYRQFIIDNFDWVTFEAHSKWRDMESNKTEDDSKFDGIDTALTWLLSNNKKVRGHSLLSNVLADQPDWLNIITDPDVFTSELERRVDYMTDRFFNRFSHVDISNKHSSGEYLQTKTQNDVILADMVLRVNRNFSGATFKPFLDSSITNALHTTKSVNSLRRVQLAGGNVSGLAVPGQFSSAISSQDIELIKRRLDVTRTLALPIWITELQTSLADLHERATFLDDLLTLFFGTPGVGGVLLSNINQIANPSAGDFELTAAGTVWTNLTQNSWRTNEVFAPSSSSLQSTFRAFYGDYDVMVFYNGRVVSETSFRLTPEADKEISVTFTC